MVRLSLSQVARTAQLAAHPPDRVRSRELVAAIRSQDQQRLLGECSGQRRQQFQSRVVGPLQVIEKSGRLPRCDRRQCKADRFESVAGSPWGCWAELGQQQCQVIGKRSLDKRPAARGTKVGTQHLHQRRER